MSPTNRLLRTRIAGPLRFALVLFPVVLMTRAANGQSAACTAVHVDETIAKIHVNKKHDEYQDLEELGHSLLRELREGGSEVQPVQLQVDVDQQGKTTAVTPISGLPELSSMYVAWFNRILWIPFKENSQPVCAQFMVYVVPRLKPEAGPEFRGKEKFHSLLEKCTDSSPSGTNAAEMVSTCQQAADAGGPLPVSYFGKDKRLAYVTTATALMRVNRAKEALPYAEKAVETSNLGWDDVTGKASAYGVRGQARALNRDLIGADQDLTKAEALERATFEVPRKPEHKTFDTHALKSMLGFHAMVLTAMHRNAEAEKLRDEAKKL